MSNDRSSSPSESKGHWGARLAVISIGVVITGWGWLLVRGGFDFYPTRDRFGRPMMGYSRNWIYWGVFLVAAALVLWQRILSSRGRDKGRGRGRQVGG